MSQEPDLDLVLSSKGEPYATKGAAVSSLKQKKLEGTHEVQEYGDGWAIVRRVEDSSEPAAVEAPAPEPVPPVKPKPANEVPRSASIDDLSIEELETALARRKVNDGKNNNPEFARVRFHEKSDPQQPQDVFLGCNGEPLTIMRGMEVVIPRRFREVADNAVERKFTQKPGETRKLVAYVKKWPYDYLGEATEAEFLKHKREGMQELLKRLKGQN